MNTYPNKIYECITNKETLLVSHEEAIVLSSKLSDKRPGWRIWNFVEMSENSAIYQYLNAFILVKYSKQNDNYFVWLESASDDYRTLLLDKELSYG